MSSSIPLIVSSCDKCSDLWQPFFWLLKKHWTGFDRKVYLCTDSKTFGYEGVDIECPLSMPKGSTWSENLMSLLSCVDAEYVLFMLDDFWLKRTVDLERLARCEKVIMKDKSVGFICLIKQLEPSEANLVSEEYTDLIEYGQNTPYRVTTQVGLWRKDFLMSLLRKHESAWWFEMFGSKRSRLSKYRSYVVRESIFDYDDGGVLFRGSYVKEYVDYFKDDKNVVLSKLRRIEEKASLMSEIKELSFIKKLNPKFIYNYLRSQF